jgi:hypothetical protein
MSQHRRRNEQVEAARAGSSEQKKLRRDRLGIDKGERNAQGKDSERPAQKGVSADQGRRGRSRKKAARKKTS